MIQNMMKFSFFLFIKKIIEIFFQASFYIYIIFFGLPFIISKWWNFFPFFPQAEPQNYGGNEKPKIIIWHHFFLINICKCEKFSPKNK